MTPKELKRAYEVAREANFKLSMETIDLKAKVAALRWIVERASRAECRCGIKELKCLRCEAREVLKEVDRPAIDQDAPSPAEE
jgi:hypothetical protein